MVNILNRSENLNIPRVRQKINLKTKTISVVIPALNEKDGIQHTIQSIPYASLKRSGYMVEVLVVDGCSCDGTPELAKKAGATVIKETLRGYGRAYKTGFEEAQGEIIVTADADGTRVGFSPISINRRPA